MNPDSTCIEREALIQQSLLSGQTYQEIGNSLGVKRQRVQQIAKRIGVASCSQALKKQKRAEVLAPLLARPCFLCGLPANRIRSTERFRLYCLECRRILKLDSRRLSCALMPKVATLLWPQVVKNLPPLSRMVIAMEYGTATLNYYLRARLAIHRNPQFDWPAILKKVAEGVRE